MGGIATESAKQHRSRRCFIRGVTFVLIVLVTVTAWHTIRNPVDGYLILGTHFDDHDCQIYVGDRLVGTGCAKVPWAEIIGWRGHEPLGILLPEDAAWPPRPSPPGSNAQSSESVVSSTNSPALSVSEATARRVVGEDAAVVYGEAGSPPLSSYGTRHRFAHKEMLIRRPNGTLDHVFCLDAGITDVLGRTYRVLVPIRIRSPNPQHARIFTSSSNYFTRIERKGDDVVAFGTERVPRNGWIHRYSHVWGFRSADPPDEFAAEIKEGGLWKPDS